MIIIQLTILALLIIFFVDRFRIVISEKTKLIDKPNKIRKFHKKDTPLLGGIMIFSTFFLINIYLFFFGTLDKIDQIIFFTSTCCFFLGLVDDSRKLTYKYKFISLIILFTFFVSLEPNLQITKIYFITFDKYVYLGNYSIFFTVLCLILLTNAINLIDGVDGLCILVNIILLTWMVLTFKDISSLYIIMIIALFSILLLNLKKNIFIGDSGSLFLGSLVGLLLIYNYNSQLLTTNYPTENIFIILMLPGLDMFAVFFQRALKKRNPFSPDRLHLHYLLFDKNLKLNKILTVFLILILTPIFINFFTNTKPIHIILGFSTIYIFFILSIGKLKTK